MLPLMINLICSISVLSLQLKDDAVALVDVFSPSDFVLNSPIGNADGQVKTYTHISFTLRKSVSGLNTEGSKEDLKVTPASIISLL